MTVGLGVAIGLCCPLFHFLLQLPKTSNNFYRRLIRFSWISSTVCKFEWTLDVHKSNPSSQVYLRMTLKVSMTYHPLYNTVCIKSLLRNSKVGIGQCMNANDSYPVGVLSKFTPPSCKITVIDKQCFSWRKWLPYYSVLGKVLDGLWKVVNFWWYKLHSQSGSPDHFLIHSYLLHGGSKYLLTFFSFLFSKNIWQDW